MNFTVVGAEKLRTCIAAIGNSTAVLAGDVVEASSGLVIKGTATGAKLAYSPKAHANGDGTQIEITVGNDFVLSGTGDATYAVADKGTAADLVVPSAQQIDVSASSTNVFIVCMEQPAAVVGVATNIYVVIALPLF